MLSFLKPPIAEKTVPVSEIDIVYKKKRIQVFIGIFIGYAAYYLVRKNFALAMPYLTELGYSKTELGFALSGVAISYGLSKFIMGNVSDRSNAKLFMPIGLFISALIMLFMGFSPFPIRSVGTMFILLLLNGWVQGMGWPASGRVMVHWFSQSERGTKMAFWNIAHNIGGGLVGIIAIWGISLFGDWKSVLYFPALFAIVISTIIYFLIIDTPKASGLPPIEIYKKEEASHVSNNNSTLELFKTYILHNKALWLIAFANLFVYFIRYGVIDWAPTYLYEVKALNKEDAAWAFTAYEFAGIPGTLLCGWLSDKYFSNRRAPVSIICMLIVLMAILIYWLNPPGNFIIDLIALIAIGFLIYGPVMLIGVHALDISHKNAAGTAAGFTGLFGYLGGAVLANALLGIVVDQFSWNGGFALLFISGIIAIIFLYFSDKK